MNRIDRISAILIQLQSRRVVKAQFIADRFDISLRTVYRDIRTLEEAGVPIIGEAGTGYSLADGYRLPPIAFTLEEATALFTAEKLVETLTDEVNSGSYQSAMYKVRAVLRNVEKDYLAGIDSRVEVLKGRRTPQLHEGVNPMQPILKAIAEKKVVSLKYFSYYRQVHTERCVEPVGVFYLDRYWHLIGFCRMQNDYRDFRFDRMLDVKLTDENVIKQHPALKTYIENNYHERDVHKVVLRVNKKMSLHLGDEKLYHGLVGEVDLGDEIEMTFLTGFMEGFARWFLFFADYATIIEPESLREKAKEVIDKVLLKL